MQFHDMTIEWTGEIRSRRVFQSEDLARAAVAVFAKMLDNDEPDTRQAIPVPGLEHITLHFTSVEPGAALATFYSHEALVTTSILLADGDPAAHVMTRQAFQRSLLAITRPHGIEPSFASMEIEERPVMLTVPFPSNPNDAMMVADMGTCLAAACFEDYTLQRGGG